MKIAVVGATGLVGSTMIKILEERDFPVSELIPVASEKSEGKEILFRNKTFHVVSPAKAVEMNPQIALFSAGATVSRHWAPLFANARCRVVDNSSCWRMDPDVKLIIPEINGNILTTEDYLIANPNCSTIQMLMALAPLHKAFRLKRIVVSTYQSVSGTGQKGVKQLSDERQARFTGNETGKPIGNAYPYPIDLNVIPQIDVFLPDGYTKEEIKMVNETHKILDDHSIGVSATTVRVPVTGGHSESVNAQFEKPFTLEQVRELLESFPGVTLQDHPGSLTYPMPLFSEGSDQVFVGRLRYDLSCENTLNMWVVSDNLRKGAATNAVQIVEKLTGLLKG